MRARVREARLTGAHVSVIDVVETVVLLLVVLDEPTAGLDALATRRVIDPLRRLADGRTLIMISHDLSIAPFADKILVLDQGRPVEQGTHNELLRANGHYACLHEEQNPSAMPLSQSYVPVCGVLPIQDHATPVRHSSP